MIYSALSVFARVYTVVLFATIFTLQPLPTEKSGVTEFVFVPVVE